MFLILLFIQTSYIILSKSKVESYVLFAANIDDFKSIAKKMIPEQSAELTDVSEQQNPNYRHGNKNDPNDYEFKEYRTRKFDGTDEYDQERSKSNEESYSDVPTEYANLKANNKRISKKKYQITNQDLDELVERVKEKLQTEFEIASKVTDDKTKTVKNKLIEDYYYKDDAMNVNFNEDVADEVEKSPSLTIKKPKYETDYEDVQFNGEQNKDMTIPKYNKGSWNAKHDAEYVSKKTTTNFYEPTIYHNGEEVRNVNKVKRPGYNEDDSEHKGIARYNEREHSTTPEVNYEDNANYEEDFKPEDQDTYKKIDMRKSNDSYEDYVTPKREEMFESTEAKDTNFKPKKSLRNDKKFASQNHRQDKAAVRIDDSVISNVKKVDFDTSSQPSLGIPMRSPRPREVKAKTANMWYKEPDIQNYDESIKELKENANKSTKKHMNTMFPTKAHVKFSSPNYFAKLPAVAEKYNFNEPIPENDREPEKLKYFGNPEASINKKVKI